MNWDELCERLESQLDQGDYAAVSSWVDEFVAAVEADDEFVPTDTANRILTVLQNYARFPALRRIGELVRRRNNEPGLRRRLAQSHIEMGDVTQAIGDLLDLQSEIENELAKGVSPAEIPKQQELANEQPEIVGLLGRAYKKLYRDANPTPQARRAEDFQRSYDYYLHAYKSPHGNVWHGINLIALLAFHDRVISNAEFTNNREIQAHADTILANTPENSTDVWDLATRAEALLAQGKNRDAREALAAYLTHEKTTVFHIQSTRRQFREMWGLTPDKPPGNTMLPMLDAAFAKKGGQLEVESVLKVGANLESILADTGFQPIGWLRTALDRAKSVARIGRKPHATSTKQASGTGFLFDGKAIHDSLAGKPLVLTNSHVTTSSDEVRQKYSNMDILEVSETKAAFLEHGDKQSRSISVVKEWFTSPPWELDATLLELSETPEGVEVLPISEEDPVKKERVNILGHPAGNDMVVALQDNRVVGIDNPRLFYRTPTEPGSSGSPVFNQDWDLVALHHAGPGFSNSDANEGLLIGPVIEAIKAQVSAQ